MQLFIVIYIFGHIAGTMDPVSSDMEACRVEAGQARTVRIERFSDNSRKPQTLFGRVVTKDDIRYECQFSKSRPLNSIDELDPAQKNSR
jgi:hypothetical protein